jgi:hypothetical protein
MSRVLKDELQELRQKLMTCFRETLPSKQFNALLSLPIIWLHVLADREEKIKDEEERGRLMNEFERGKSNIEKGIQILYEQTKNKRDQENLATDNYSRTDTCPECGDRTFRQGGCPICISSGWSPCG